MITYNIILDNGHNYDYNINIDNRKLSERKIKL